MTKKKKLWDAGTMELTDIPCHICQRYKIEICPKNCDRLIVYVKSSYIPDARGLRYNDAMKVENKEAEEEKEIKEKNSQNDVELDALKDGEIKYQPDDQFLTELNEDVFFRQENAKSINPLKSNDGPAIISKGEPLRIHIEGMLGEAKIFRLSEKMLKEQFFTFLECTEIAIIAELAGESKQNIHKKISRRIDKLSKYMIKNKGALAIINSILQKKEKKEKKMEDIVNPLAFKKALNLTDAN